MKFLALVAVLALMVCQAKAYGQDGGSIPPSGIKRVEVPGLGTIDYLRLFEAVSEPGESLDNFALRIGPNLRAFSDDTGFEACGIIASDGERFGVIVGSSQAHALCANFTDKVPEGMKANGQTIHSHPRGDSYKINATDRAFLGPLYRIGDRYTRSNRGVFSADDFSAGPGYLVSPSGAIYYQAGRDSVRKITE